MSALEQAEYIVQCLRTAGSMYEEDARAFLAEHDGHVRASALREAATLAEQRTGGPAEQRVLLDFATQLRRAANARETATAPAATPFFQIGHTYAREHHGRTIEFHVVHIATAPDCESQTAFGWRKDPEIDVMLPMDSDDFHGCGWNDITPAGGR